jgi:hypothetical protein
LANAFETGCFFAALLGLERCSGFGFGDPSRLGGGALANLRGGASFGLRSLSLGIEAFGLDAVALVSEQ